MTSLLTVSLSAAFVTFACLALTPAPSDADTHTIMHEDVVDTSSPSFSI